MFGLVERGRTGTFSTPQGLRRRWFLSAAAMHDGRPGHSRRGVFSTPDGVRRGGPSPRPLRAPVVQGIAG
eukprot:1370239-Pyramimonas_sp.AAC.1